MIEALFNWIVAPFALVLWPFAWAVHGFCRGVRVWAWNMKHSSAFKGEWRMDVPE